MFDKLEDILIRFEEIMGELNEPTVTNNQERFRKLMKEQSDLTPIVEAYKEYKKETNDDRITVVVSTASPYKFPTAVLEAFDIKEDDAIKAIEVLSKTFNIDIPEVLNYPPVKRTVVALGDADNYVKDVIKCFTSR